MQHSLTLEGLAFRLRPITDADAAFVVELRNDPTLNRFLHRSCERVEDQLVWLASYYERAGDYYFVLERVDSSATEGVISIYDVDTRTGSGEWGRWILKPGSLAAVESAWLIYRCAFELLALNRIFCRTVAENLPVISFHDSCGITARRFLPGAFNFDGKAVDAIEHEVTQQSWGEIAPRLEKLAKLAARSVRHG